MNNITAVVDQYMAVWHEPDPEIRRRRIAKLWTPDGVTCHRLLHCKGYDAIEERVANAYDKWIRAGGFIFQSRKNVVGHHNVGKFNWEMVPAGGGEIASVGFDFFILANDGRIQFNYQFNEACTPAEDLNLFVDRYVAAWNEPDGAARRKSISGLWCEDATYINELHEQHGHRAIETAISEAYQEYGTNGFIFRSAKNADGHHNVIRFNWEMLPVSSDQVMARGFDFLVLGDDGRIRHDYQFSEPLSQTDTSRYRTTLPSPEYRKAA